MVKKNNYWTLRHWHSSLQITSSFSKKHSTYNITSTIIQKMTHRQKIKKHLDISHLWLTNQTKTNEPSPAGRPREGMVIAGHSAVVHWVSHAIVWFIVANAALIILQTIRFCHKPRDRGQLHGASHSPNLQSDLREMHYIQLLTRRTRTKHPIWKVHLQLPPDLLKIPLKRQQLRSSCNDCWEYLWLCSVGVQLVPAGSSVAGIQSSVAILMNRP